MNETATICNGTYNDGSPCRLLTVLNGKCIKHFVKEQKQESESNDEDIHTR